MTRKTECACKLGDLLDTRLFKALGDPTRVGLLARLAECCRPQSVNEVGQCCTIDLSVVSRHLAALREAGVLAATKQGRQVRYSVRYHELAQLLRELADRLESCCSTEGPKSKEKIDESKGR